MVGHLSSQWKSLCRREHPSKSGRRTEFIRGRMDEIKASLASLEVVPYSRARVRSEPSLRPVPQTGPPQLRAAR
eukprot:1286867-Lingulodinium_polyedra.AAC.1